MLLVVGFDGATWDVIEPLIAAGRMPNVARLRAAGTWGKLRSTTPPVTFPSWTSFMTGVNPGKHGIFDFTRRKVGSYEVEFVNSTFRKVPTIWNRLSAHAKRICILGLPATFPPESVNGCMVSGFDSPVATRADRSFVSPPGMFDEVERAGGFPFADFQEFRIGPGWHEAASAAMLRAIANKRTLGMRLLEREAWDCFLLLFGESDTAAHHFWRFHDPHSPRFAAAPATEFGDTLASVYEALDAALGALWDSVPGANVMMVSDHGFGGTNCKAVALNEWLAQAGFLRRRPRSVSNRSLAAVKRLALEIVPSLWQQRLFRMGGGFLASALESRVRFAGIDWGGTQAFSEELNYFPSVWINLRGREPEGVVDPDDYDRVVDDICAASTMLTDPDTGRPIVRKAWRREEVYDGPWVVQAPDIILEYELDGGYSYMTLPSAGRVDSALVWRIPPSDSDRGKLTGMSGSHRPEGVFALAGPQVKADGYQEGARIEDAAATILSLCGIESPKEFDGRTLSLGVDVTECLGREPTTPLSERGYEPREEAEIAARLADLGYLE